ncbi:unnamed protein product [Periconia digitata]|uniref:Uncharacterized protein n=1 Tax=Periconia digitata TaxID=1303443 RepID=A0A9W4XPB2_9PLEO|nr:unnamed protein product [Periconia digitata]
MVVGMATARPMARGCRSLPRPGYPPRGFKDSLRKRKIPCQRVIVGLTLHSWLLFASHRLDIIRPKFRSWYSVNIT